MLVATRFRAIGTWVQIGLLTLFLSTVLTWVAFTTTGWGGYPRSGETYSYEGKHFGLWRKCSDWKFIPNCVELDGWGLEWYIAFQAFVTLGFIGVNLSLLLLMLYIVHPSCHRDKDVEKAAAISCFVTGVLYCVGVVVFAVNYNRDWMDEEKYKYGYCFSLSIVAIVLQGITGAFLLLDICQVSSQPSILLSGAPSTQPTVQQSTMVQVQYTADQPAVLNTAEKPIVQPTEEQPAGHRP